MKKSINSFVISIFFFVQFTVWTFLVKVIDVQAIGPNNSKVGFATFNKKVFELIGTSNLWYSVSEILGYCAILVCVCFGFAGLVQLIKGRGFKGVDNKILLLGGFYIIVIGLYVAFDKIAINLRPILESDGTLEASYPSSHTMLALCVFCTMFMQEFFNRRKNNAEKAENTICASLLVGVMLFSRLLSGVHWVTDIIGSVLISVALILLYKGFIELVEGK